MDHTEFIVPMTSWKLGNVFANQGIGSGSSESRAAHTNLFKDVFVSAINNVKTTQLDVENKQYLLATGQLSDAHSLPIAEAKAQISLDLLVSLRNKALDSYNELMKMNM
ncbi:flagellar hook-basal body complex protein FliE [Oribacterium parvum ACB1]|jgi:flagellar hook-basal body complex protein fliE|uniref:Flagellar hook-basal body complex protein FliE n=1 Tax=Oribacterium parvum ACB1 TaxID=796943 RepID=G9WNN3_9FIRM|nr:flagellar hook-basal body complex protein FliE [Oribacterium parvum]EHL10770.1 flagellar hook-basal body complex protein FliE [Oribacterium parvum ACB1]EJF12083.1 flagellar hook-basal body complex protein FliE [Oribacterium parvum ACB8]